MKLPPTCWVPDCETPTDMVIGGVCLTHHMDEQRAISRGEYLRGLDMDDLYPERVEYRDALAERRKIEARRRALANVKAADWTGDGSRYGCAAITRIMAELPARAAEEGRNNALNRAAWSVGRLVAGGELETGKALRALHEVGIALGLSRHEVHATVNSGFNKGLDMPRTAPGRAA